MTHKKVDRLFNLLKRKNLLDDRSQFDKEDLQKAYPQLTKKEVGLLHSKLQRWRK